MNQINNRTYIYDNFGKYLFTGIFLFIFIFSQCVYAQEEDAGSKDTATLSIAAADDTKQECKTCSGPSDEMITYRNFLKWAIDSISLKKPWAIDVNDEVKWLAKNANSALKWIAYWAWSTVKTSFRKTLYNGKSTVFGMQNFVKNLLSLWNISKLRELQTLDRYADMIDQLSLKLIETKQRNQNISDSDMAKLKTLMDKYSDWSAEDKMFASKASASLEWKKYSDFMKFLLNINGKLQRFVVWTKMKPAKTTPDPEVTDETKWELKTINTSENSLSTDLAANRDTEFITKITKSYACSRWLFKCNSVKKSLNDISENFKDNMKNQKSEIQSSVNGLKRAMSKFNNTVIWAKNSDYGSDLSDTNTDKKWSLKNHFEINTSIDPKLQDMISNKQDTKNKLANAKAIQNIKKQILSQKSNNDPKSTYKITLNNKQSDYNANILAKCVAKYEHCDYRRVYEVLQNMNIATT